MTGTDNTFSIPQSLLRNINLLFPTFYEACSENIQGYNKF